MVSAVSAFRLIRMYTMHTTIPLRFAHHRHCSYALACAHTDTMIGRPWCGASALSVGRCLVPMHSWQIASLVQPIAVYLAHSVVDQAQR